MFPPITLIIFLNILFGQIPGYVAPGGESSSAREYYRSLGQVQDLLVANDRYPVPRHQYYSLFMNARRRAELPWTEEKVKELLHAIVPLGDLEHQDRHEGGIRCTDESIGIVMNVMRAINGASEENEFALEARKHPLNTVILDIADMLFQRCSGELNDKLEQIRLPAHADETRNKIKYALIHMDRFQKFLKLPGDPVYFGYGRKVPYSAIALDDKHINVNTELEPGDLKWLGVPQETEIPRNDLLKKIVERTCNRIDNDETLRDIFQLGLKFVQATLEFYENTGEQYYFRNEFGLYRICKVVEASIATVMDED